MKNKILRRGNACEPRGDLLPVVDLKGPAKIDVKINRKNNAFRCEYIAQTVGEYVVNVSLAGQPVNEYSLSFFRC